MDKSGKTEKEKITIDDIANFCKRKGFIFKSSEIYGGLSGFWDYGSLGVELFNNIKQDWWNFFVHSRENMVGIEASIISHPRTWIASGHAENFSDRGVVCKKCKKAGKIDKSEIRKKCDCGGEYEIKGDFNLMFKTKIGALDSEDSYLRPETAQGMFMDFKAVFETSRKKLPFGIAQIGRCFRNEISPRDFLFRSREFNIGEFEFFIKPNDKKCPLLEKKHFDLEFNLLDKETQEKGKEILKKTKIIQILKEERLDEWHAYWLAEQILWFYSIGLKKIKIREHTKEELSHYSSATFDIDYEYPFGSKEIAGIANRGQYDLNQHMKESKQNLGIFDEDLKERIVPRVIEPTFGIERVFLAVLANAYEYDKKRENIVLKIPAKLAPVKIAILPLVKNDDKIVKTSREIFNELKQEWNVSYDESGSIGKRYARNDESGTVACITVDEDSLKDNTVTVRDRDTTEQVRVKISELQDMMRKVINEGKSILKLGKKVDTRVKE